jgi:hypothetical protein
VRRTSRCSRGALAAGLLTTLLVSALGGCTGSGVADHAAPSVTDRAAGVAAGTAGPRLSGPPLARCLPLGEVRSAVTELDQQVDAPLDDHDVTLTCGYRSADLDTPVRFSYAVGHYRDEAAAVSTYAGLRDVFDECATDPPAECRRPPGAVARSQQWRASRTSFTRVLLPAPDDIDVAAGSGPGTRTAWYDGAIRNGRYVCFLLSFTSEAVGSRVARLQTIGRQEFAMLQRACGG